MHSTHRFMIKKAIFDYGTNGENTHIRWISEHLGMVCLAAHSIWFNAEMEDVFQRIEKDRKDSMQIFFEQKKMQMNDLIEKGWNNVSLEIDENTSLL